jgi:hypothetical protein
MALAASKQAIRGNTIELGARSLRAGRSQAATADSQA